MFIVCVLCATCSDMQVAMMAVLVGVQVPWVAILTMCQLYQVSATIVYNSVLTMSVFKSLVSLRVPEMSAPPQVSCLAMTTNERMNAGRYKRFHTGKEKFLRVTLHISRSKLVLSSLIIWGHSRRPSGQLFL